MTRSPTSSRFRVTLAALAISAAGILGITQWEGYTDHAVIPIPGDVPTIGHGTTRYPDGSPVELGDKTTKREASQYLKHDLNVFEDAVRRCVKVPLHQHEYDAYVSLTYNIGPTAFCSSTLVRRLNREEYAAACAEISRWNRAGGRVVPGLVNRRASERARCEGR